MKNNFLVTICIILFLNSVSLAEQFLFEFSKVEIVGDGNLVYGTNGKAISTDKNLEIIGNEFEYNKSLNLLNVSNGEAFIKSDNLKIEFNKILVDENNLLIKAQNDIKIYDLKNEILIESENIIYDRKNNIITSLSDSVIIDKFNNLFKTKKFEYKINDKIIKIQNLNLTDFNNNNFNIEFAYLNTETNKLYGKDVSINLENTSFNKENEPRIKGRSIEYHDGETKISKGIFTPCKKTDSCPPWELSARKITHNKKKKNISYENVWLKVYDIPVIYFPKFFHPDPTVKRQSGFLMPSFKNSPNGNSFFKLPYYKVINDNKDTTFTPRLYASDKALLQNEYRFIDEDSNIISDISIFADNQSNFESHFFLKTDKKFKSKRFNDNNFKIKIQQATNTTYIKGNKIKSPIITNYDILENSLNVNLSSEDLDIDTNVIVYENLNIKSSDKYEYIFPQVDISKKIENKTSLSGDFTFESNNHIQNYSTNILEKINTNNLLFNSSPKISKKGFYNNYQFLIKNSNSSTKNSSNYKKGDDYYLSGIYQFNSSLPLIKNTNNYKNILKPKLSLKISPNNMKNLSKELSKLDTDNIYNLNRISSNETIEGGMSLTYGNEYTISDLNSSKEILTLKLANNIRLKENKDLPNNNQLSAKTSNFYGQISYNLNDFFTTKYDFSTKNNLKDINYENLGATIDFKNFVTTFDYLNEKNNFEKNSYLLNKTSYNFNKTYNMSFATRRNYKTNLTEYYNLIYQYKNDCLAASIEYNKDYYSDRDIKPKESVFFKLTIIPFGETSTPNLKK